MLAEIVLKNGEVAVIDTVDVPVVMDFTWRAMKTESGNVTYAVTSYRKGKREVIIRMHRLILSAPRGILVDHINRDGLDNRRENLRFASVSQNHINAAPSAVNTSGYKGVSFHSRTKRWRSVIQKNGVAHYLGTFATPHEAAEAYNDAAQELFGDFAFMNRVIR